MGDKCSLVPRLLEGQKRRLPTPLTALGIRCVFFEMFSFQSGVIREAISTVYTQSQLIAEDIFSAPTMAWVRG